MVTEQRSYARTVSAAWRFGVLTAVLGLTSISPVCAQNSPLEGGVQQQEYVPGSGSSYPAYPSPQMVPAKPSFGSHGQSSQFNGNVERGNQMGAPLQGGVTKVALPPAFMGVWNVRGTRKSVDAQPEFQQGAERAFTVNNQQVWTIEGSQDAYTLGSNTGIQTPIYVDKVQGTTAFFRYQHPVGNTVAQEAIVMSLTGGGAQFNGLERISIVKQGLPQPRAKVTYNLVGTRQR
jgi:hypothetical protein